jgi:hypothetical protein
VHFDAGGMTRAKGPEEKKIRQHDEKDKKKKKSSRGQTTPAADKADGTWEIETHPPKTGPGKGILDNHVPTLCR